MPGYDIAGALQYAQPGTEFNKGALAAAQTKLAEAEAIVQQKEGKYYEQNLDLKKQQVQNQKAATDIDAGKLALQYTEFYKKLQDGGISEDQKRAIDMHDKMQDQLLNVHQMLVQNGVPADKATEAVSGVMSKLMPPGSMPNGSTLFDPVLAEAARQSAKDNQKETGLRTITPKAGGNSFVAQVSEDSRSGRFFYTDKSGGRTYVSGDELSAAPTIQRTGPLSEGADVRTQQANTTNFINVSTDAIKLLNKNPDINTYAADFARLTGDMQAEVSAIANHMGINFDANSLDISNHNQAWNDLKIKNAQMRSLITTLTFARAVAQEGKNSISDKDIKRMYEEVGAENGNPQAFRQVLYDVATRADRAFRSSYKAHEGKDFEGDLGLSDLQKAFNRSGEERTTAGGIKFKIVD